MRMQISKWGNSLAVRLPMDYTRAVGLKEGDEVDAEVTPLGEIRLTPARHLDKPAFLARLAELRQAMSMSEPVVEAMRQADRY
jgi:antitoxin MazE